MDNFKLLSEIPEKYTGVCYYEGALQTRWYLNGNFHREHGPAIIGDNKYEQWFFGGLRHRLDGPAIHYPATHTHDLHYIHGYYFSPEDYWKHPLVIKHILESILNGNI